MTGVGASGGASGGPRRRTRLLRRRGRTRRWYGGFHPRGCGIIGGRRHGCGGRAGLFVVVMNANQVDKFEHDNGHQGTTVIGGGRGRFDTGSHLIHGLAEGSDALTHGIDLADAPLLGRGQDATQFGEGHLLHGKSGFDILNVPPGIAWRGAFLDLIVNAYAPMKAVGSGGVEAAEGVAVLLDGLEADAAAGARKFKSVVVSFVAFVIDDLVEHEYAWSSSAHDGDLKGWRERERERERGLY